MARFFGEMFGRFGDRSRQVVSRTGGEGISAHLRGHHIGAEVTVFVNENGEDEVVVRLTGGSKNPNEQTNVFSSGQMYKNNAVEMNSDIRFTLKPLGRLEL